MTPTCPTTDCKNPLPTKRAKRAGFFVVVTSRRICDRCYSRLKRLRDPASDVFYRLKRRAKRINVPFGFTRAGFKKMLELYPDYLQHRGSASTSLNIDRIHEPSGYVPGNLRIITKRENVGKENRRRVMAGTEEFDFSEDPDWNV